jgi:guanylate kinase
LSTADIYNLQILPIYILAPDKTRILRALNREEEPNISEIFRRYETDIEDFHYISYFYFPVYNDREPMDSNEIVSTILKHCSNFFD